MELVQPSDINKNLFILPGGSVPPNPTELLARNGLDKAIEILKQNFDYVIMDQRCGLEKEKIRLLLRLRQVR